MSAITSLLVRDGVVPVRTIVEALQRQVISGGDIETVLLEMDAVPENVLAAYRASLLDRPAATREEVMGVRDAIQRLVPAEVAIEHGIVPLEVSDRTLRIAVHDVLTPETRERLGFLLGFELDLRVVCSLRIAGALAAYYGAELEPRVNRLLGRVESRKSGPLPDIGAPADGRLGSAAIELPSKTRPSDRPREPGEVLGAFGAAPDEPAREVRTRQSSSGHLRRLRGPMTLAAGERRLKQVSTRDEILEIYFSFAQQFFDYTALFVVHDLLADGREAYGPGGARTSMVRTLSIPLDRPSAFAEAHRTRAPFVKRLDGTEIDRDLAMGMRRGSSPPALMMPLAIRQRVVLILYGDRDGEEFDLGSVMELVRFGSRVVEAFEQLIIRGKRPGYRGATDEEVGVVEERIELKDAARAVAATAGSERPRTPRESMGWRPGRRTNPGFAPPQAPPLPGADSWGHVERAPKQVEPIPNRVRAITPLETPAEEVSPRIEAALVEPALVEPALVEPALLEPQAPRRRPTAPRMPADAPPSAVLGIPRNAPPPPTIPDLRLDRISVPHALPEDDEDDDVVMTMDGDDEDDHDDDDGPVIEYEDDEEDPNLVETDAPPPPRFGSAVDEDDEPPTTPPSPKSVLPRRRPGGSYRLAEGAVEVIAVRPPRPDGPRSFPPRDSRRDEEGEPVPEVVRIPDAVRSEPPPRPPPRGLDGPTRSVIVDMGEQVHAQVDDLARTTNPRAWEPLVNGLVPLGEPALAVLAQAFPGVLVWDRGTGGALPRGRDISGIARAMCSFGERAAPYVSGLLSSAHPDVRFYAVLIATEMVHPELMDAVAERVHDEDAGVRRLAVQFLPRFGGLRGFEEIRTVVRRTARLKGKDPTRRWQAIDALAAMRDEEMIPKLIDLLREDEPELVDHVQRALNTLTGLDHGRSHRKWAAWWTRNRSRHRVEWLIDGLLAGEESIRRIAGDELTAVTQEYYGYHAGSPKKDRERIAGRYRRWWEDEGRRRFV